MRDVWAPMRYLAALIFFLVPVMAAVGTAAAGAVTLQWDSNRESDIAGYEVAYGTVSGQLTTTVDVGNHTSYQLTNLVTGRKYFFAVRAYNAARTMSAFSAEVSATVGILPLTLTTFMTNVSSPQPAGTSVIFAAGASGGTAPYQYKWFVSDGSTTRIARDWSADNTFTWQPWAGNLSYKVKAWARSARSTADAPETGSAERTLSFVITPAAPTEINLVADKEAPQPAGARIIFTATARSAGSTYQFQWSVYDGSVWTVRQDWSANATFSWTPAAANANYKVMVKVRGGTALGANTALTIPFPAQ